MKHAPEVNAWYLANLKPGTISRLSGFSRYVVGRMVQKGHLSTAVLNRLVVAHPLGQTAPTPAFPAAPETKAPAPPTAQGDELREAADSLPVMEAFKAETAKSMRADYKSAVDDVIISAVKDNLPVPQFPMKNTNYSVTGKVVDTPIPRYSNIADALPEGATVMILMPGRTIGLQTLYCVQSLIEIGRGKITLGEPSSMYDVFLNRNRLVHRFLNSGAKWSLLLDPDTILPCEKSEWWKRNVPAARKWDNPAFSALNAVNRLATHHLTNPAHKIVGACYYDRLGRGIPIFANARDNPDMARSLNVSGPRDELVSAGRYAGSGALLVHRQVYLDIMEKVPMKPEDAAALAAADWEGYTYDFFGKLRYQGDDVSFCERARLAGHQPMIDLAVCAAHIGDYAYTHEIINPPQ